MKNKIIAGAALAALMVMSWALFWPGHRSSPRARSSYRDRGKPQAPRKPAPAAKVFQRESGSDIPDSIRPIMGLDGENSTARAQALQALGNKLSRAEIEALYGFLLSADQGDFTLQNDVINAIRGQLNPPSDFLAVLRQLHRDPQQNMVGRDYALQHLVAEYEKSPTNAAANHILELFWDALSVTNSSTAGTALLGLHRLCGVDPSIDSNKVSQAALQLTLDASTGELTRITALQVCAQRRLHEVLPTAITLAQQSSSLTLRLSAIAALGDVGGKDEKKLLELLATEGILFLQPAIQSALKRLDQRLVTSQSSIGAAYE